jgi:hypothetical protein
MAGVHDDWKKIHDRRKAEGQGQGKETGHNESKHIPTGNIQVGRPDLDEGSRPELHLYTFIVNNQLRHRFRARLHSYDKAALVIRVDPAFSENEEVVVDGDGVNGLFVLETGEIVIRPQSGRKQRFEFTVDNPGGGVGDYSC